MNNEIPLKLVFQNKSIGIITPKHIIEYKLEIIFVNRRKKCGDFQKWICNPSRNQRVEIGYMARIKLTMAEQEDNNQGKFQELTERIIDTSGAFYRRGWLYATSGNLSAVAEENPFRLAITASGVDKGNLTASHVIGIDENGAVLNGQLRPSSETLIHLIIVKKLGAKSVMHTHSIWGTLLSEKFSGNGGIEISGYEMLKGLRGVESHQNSEWIPILGNSQDMTMGVNTFRA